MEGGASATPLRWHGMPMTLPGLAGSFHFRGRTSRPTLSKKVTSLLLFTAEKFAAVDDKLTKKALFPVGARFSRRSVEAWLASLLVYGVRFVASKTIHCRKNNEDYDRPYC
jgi:hypothetical protein